MVHGAFMNGIIISYHVIYIYFASQMYKVIIIRNLQYIYENLKLKIYFLCNFFFYSFVYMEGRHINKEFVVGRKF